MEKKDYNFAIYAEDVDYFSIKLASEEYKVIEKFLEELNNSSRNVLIKLYNPKDVI